MFGALLITTSTTRSLSLSMTLSYLNILDRHLKNIQSRHQRDVARQTTQYERRVASSSNFIEIKFFVARFI